MGFKTGMFSHRLMNDKSLLYTDYISVVVLRKRGREGRGVNGLDEGR